MSRRFPQRMTPMWQRNLVVPALMLLTLACSSLMASADVEESVLRTDRLVYEVPADAAFFVIHATYTNRSDVPEALSWCWGIDRQEGAGWASAYSPPCAFASSSTILPPGDSTKRRLEVHFRSRGFVRYPITRLPSRNRLVMSATLLHPGTIINAPTSDQRFRYSNTFEIRLADRAEAEVEWPPNETLNADAGRCMISLEFSMCSSYRARGRVPSRPCAG